MTTLQQSGFKKDVSGSYISKDPDSILDYSVDWTDWAQPGETITTTTFTVESGGANLTLANPGSLTNIATVTISGGDVGNIYVIKNTIVTNNDNTDVRRFRVKVEKRFA
jgi:hypothetical protein